MTRLQYVTYCGLYCKLCAHRGRIPEQAQALRTTLHQEGYDSWGKDVAGFKEFWGFLCDLCDVNKACPGCREGGGYPDCVIRTCARERGLDVCPHCTDFPCAHIQALDRIYPTLIADGLRLKRIGFTRWIEEQEARAKNGFVYADIRYDQ